MDWFTALQNYNLVVENKSFSKAAKQRYASPSALSKQISWLEKQLGQKLLYRSPHQLALTEAGKALYQKSKIWLSEFNEFKTHLQRKHAVLSGPLRVTVAHTYGSTILVKHIPKFLGLYPKIQLEIQLENQYRNLIEENIDIAIRTSETTEKSLNSIPMGYKRIGIFAAPSYLKSSQKITTLKDLCDHQCLAHQDFIPPNLWRFKNHTINITPYLLTNDLDLLIISAILGRGIVYISEYVVEHAVKEKKLVPILPSMWQKEILYSLVYPRQNYLNEKIKAFINFVQSIKW